MSAPGTSLWMRLLSLMMMIVHAATWSSAAGENVAQLPPSPCKAAAGGGRRWEPPQAVIRRFGGTPPSQPFGIGDLSAHHGAVDGPRPGREQLVEGGDGQGQVLGDERVAGDGWDLAVVGREHVSKSGRPAEEACTLELRRSSAAGGCEG